MARSPAKLVSTSPCTEWCVASLINTEFGSAMDCKRAAKFTVSPRTVPPAPTPSSIFPTTAAPVLRPISHLWPETVLRFQARFGGLEPLQNRQRRTTGPKRCVLERDRRAEYRHDAVASEVLNNAAVFAHAVGH